MAKAPKFIRQHNFVNDEAQGLTSPAPSKLDAEIDAIQETVNQTRNRLENIINVAGALKPNQVVNGSLTEINAVDEFTASGGTPETFTFSTAIDTTYNTAHVYKNGELQATTGYTLNNADVRLNTTAGDTIAVHFYDVQDSTLTLLADDTVGTEGADLVGFADESGYGASTPITGTPTTVKEGLDLALSNLVSLGSSLLPVAQWVKTDGTNELSANWDVGGTYRITNHPASTTDGEVVVHEQLQSLSDDLSDLNLTFVSITGSSTMTGNLDLGSNNIVNLAAATVSGQAVEYDQLNTALALQLSLTGGTMSGDIDMDSTAKLLNLIDPATAQEPATKNYVDTFNAEGFLTAETDTTLVLRPDGSGGVEFGVTPSSLSSKNLRALGAAYSNENTGVEVNATTDALVKADLELLTYLANLRHVKPYGDATVGGVTQSVEYRWGAITDGGIEVDDLRAMILLFAEDSGGGGVADLWAADVTNISYGASGWTLSFSEIASEGSGVSGPTSKLIPHDDAWTEIFSVIETGSVGASGTWASVEARSNSGTEALDFRVRARDDSGSDLALSSIAIDIGTQG